MQILSSICHKSATPWKYLCLFFDFFFDFFQIPINRMTVNPSGLLSNYFLSARIERPIQLYIIHLTVRGKALEGFITDVIGTMH